ncbi:MAG TPA: chemotaxis protein CheD [Methanolinea sp.]|nr:chemotaxis protein CheD [Methanolinea sp.]
MMPGPEEQVVMVGIGEYHIGRSPMSSIGLGSCIGLVIHDPVNDIGGLAHIMLPDSQGRTDRPAKYADTAVEFLIRGICRQGSKPDGLVSKIVGGASMFQSFSGNLNIGDRNIEAVKIQLKKFNIRIVAEDTGGIQGRTIVYYPEEKGKISVRTADGNIRFI